MNTIFTSQCYWVGIIVVIGVVGETTSVCLTSASTDVCVAGFLIERNGCDVIVGVLGAVAGPVVGGDGSEGIALTDTMPRFCRFAALKRIISASSTGGAWCPVGGSTFVPVGDARGTDGGVRCGGGLVAGGADAGFAIALSYFKSIIGTFIQWKLDVPPPVTRWPDEKPLQILQVCADVVFVCNPMQECITMQQHVQETQHKDQQNH